MGANEVRTPVLMEAILKYHSFKFLELIVFILFLLFPIQGRRRASQESRAPRFPGMEVHCRSDLQTDKDSAHFLGSANYDCNFEE